MAESDKRDCVKQGECELNIQAIHPFDMYELLQASEGKPIARGQVSFAWYQEAPDHSFNNDIIELDGKMYLETARVAYKSTMFENPPDPSPHPTCPSQPNHTPAIGITCQDADDEC